MDVLARPWNGLILASLASGPTRFSALRARVEVMGDRMLSNRLKDLEARGLVSRQILPGRPVGVEYRLTPLGIGFRDVSTVLSRWGARIAAAEPALTRARKRARSP